MNRRRILKSVVLMGPLLALLIGLSPASEKAASAQRPVGSNGGDGGVQHALIVGVQWEDLGKDPAEDAGAVNVLYGYSAGLSAPLNQLWSQDSPLVDGTAEDFDGFGSALAGGDFNGDGYVDLAVGVPGEDTGGVSGAGVVQILYSANGRLSGSNDQIWSQGSSGVAGALETSDGFGYAVATGDFDGDGYDDLAVGVPREDNGGETDSGAVNVLYGSSDGLSSAGNQLWDQDDFFAGTTEPGDMFGWALAAGYFDADDYADLAVGAPFEDWGATEDTGAVQVLYGSAGGLADAGGQTWSQNDASDLREAEDEFGYSLAVGDFDDNGYDDLAIGAPGETVDGRGSAGAVNVLYGLFTGLAGADSDFWYQDGTYIRDALESGDHFGRSLAAGDFDGNGHDDLAVGVPDEHIGLVGDAGAVNVLYGDWNGLTADFTQFWHQDIVGETAEEEDGFGHSLTAGAFDGDDRDDLAIGVPFEDVDSIVDAGAVHVIYGTGAGLARNPQFWHQDSPDVLGLAEEADGFGLALTAIEATTSNAFLPLVLK